MEASALDENQDSWRLFQIASLLRHAERLHLPILATLRPLGPGLSDHASVRLSPAELEEIEATAAAIADLADQLDGLAERLSVRPLEITRAKAKGPAAAELAWGIFDRSKALLAAQLLDRLEGWSALASSLRSTDAHNAWGNVTVAQMLGCFRGVDPRFLATALSEADVPAEAIFAECDRDAVARLARVLVSASSR
jgi:hypothetical protein